MSTLWDRISFESLHHWASFPLSNANLSWYFQKFPPPTVPTETSSDILPGMCTYNHQSDFAQFFTRLSKYFDPFALYQCTSGQDSLMTVEETLTEHKRARPQYCFQSTHPGFMSFVVMNTLTISNRGRFGGGIWIMIPAHSPFLREKSRQDLKAPHPVKSRERRNTQSLLTLNYLSPLLQCWRPLA